MSAGADIPVTFRLVIPIPVITAGGGTAGEGAGGPEVQLSAEEIVYPIIGFAGCPADDLNFGVLQGLSLIHI